MSKVALQHTATEVDTAVDMAHSHANNEILDNIGAIVPALIEEHDESNHSHDEIRQLIQGLSDRMAALESASG